MTTPARVVIAPPNTEELQVVDVELPDPGPTEVVVRQVASGVCHSQLHQIHRPRSQPLLLGHEGTGTVVAAGRDVSHVGVGDAVMVTWVPRSPEAATTWRGGAQVALGDGAVAQTPDCFTWATHTIADGQLVVRIPADVDHDVTAVIGCAVITGAGAVLHSAAVQRGDAVAVFGVGGVGLCAVAAAKAVGADPIIAVDLDPAKLDFARRFGATHGVDGSGGDAVEQVRAITAGRYDGIGFRGREIAGVDYAFDCIGADATLQQVFDAARPGRFGVASGGTAVLVGIPTSPGYTINPFDLIMQEKHLIGSIGGTCTPDVDIPRFFDWYADGRLPLRELVTQRFALDEVNEACAALATGKIAGRAILELS